MPPINSDEPSSNDICAVASSPVLIFTPISSGVIADKTSQSSDASVKTPVAPISGFISQKSENLGLFIKTAHNGIDIVAKEGTPILASASGVVVFSGWTYEYGNMIILYHGDDYFTHYGHNEQKHKKQLDNVKRGERKIQKN